MGTGIPHKFKIWWARRLFWCEEQGPQVWKQAVLPAAGRGRLSILDMDAELTQAEGKSGQFHKKERFMDTRQLHLAHGDPKLRGSCIFS